MSIPPPLRGIDLNLLVTLRALLREESVTQAAKRIGQTQPTVSRALAHLRTTFDDPLLVRSGRAMTLTPTARALKAPVERLLAAVDRLPDLVAFDPLTSTRSFRVVLPDILGHLVLGPLTRALAAQAPGVGLQVRGSEQDVLQHLLHDRIDLAIGARPIDHPELYTRRAGVMTGWSVLMAADHPARDDLDIESWAAGKHVVVTPQGAPSGGSALDGALHKAGVQRRISTTVDYLGGLPPLLRNGHSFASLPSAIARALAEASEDLVHRPHPLADALPQLSPHLTWHELHHEDPGCRWLRQRIIESLEAALA